MNSVASTATKPTKPAQAEKGDTVEPAQSSLPLTTGKLPRGLLVPFYKCVQRMAKKIDPRTGKPRGYSVVWLQTFATWFKRTVRTIQGWIAELVACGWLHKDGTPGKKDLFLYPLLERIPPMEAWSPTPTRPFLAPKTSQVASRVDSPHTSYKGSYGASFPSGYSPVKQQKAPAAVPAPLDAAKAYADDPIKARAAADLLACGFWERGIPGLLSVVPAEIVIDACAIARWRKAKGEDVGGTGPGEGLGGYVKTLATRLHTKEWQAPKLWLQAVGRLPKSSKPAPKADQTGKNGASSAPALSSEPETRKPLPLGTPESDRWAAGEEKRAEKFMMSSGTHGVRQRRHPDNLALIERLAKSAVAWTEGDTRDERLWRDRANQISNSGEYLYFPLDWTEE